MDSGTAGGGSRQTGAAEAAASHSRRGPSKGDLKEQALLATAEQLLSEKPIHAIGVDELARGAGISRPSFYFYFDSKFAVLHALVDRVVRETYEIASGWLADDEAPPEESVRHNIEAVVEQWRRHGHVLRAAVETWGTVPEMGRYWEAIAAGFVEAAAAKITRERRAGAAPAGSPDPRALATALVWMNERCLYTASIGAPTSLSTKELVDTLSTIWLRSIYGSYEAISEQPPSRARAGARAHLAAG